MQNVDTNAIETAVRLLISGDLEECGRRRRIACEIDKWHFVDRSRAAVTVEYTFEYKLIVSNVVGTQSNWLHVRARRLTRYNNVFKHSFVNWCLLHCNVVVLNCCINWHCTVMFTQCLLNKF